MGWNPSLHPRTPKGTPAGGQFKGGSGGGSKKNTGGRPSFAALQKLEHRAQAGGKLTKAQKSELHAAHVAHVAHREHVAAEKARRAAAKAAKRGKTAPVKVSAAQRAALRMSAAKMGR